MSSLISPNICTPILTWKKPRFSHSLLITAQIPRDHHEGRSRNIVDANLHLLKVRVEEVRKKKRLERCCVAEQGWNYASVKNFKTKRETTINQEIMAEFLEIVGLIGSTLGITISACSLGLFLIAFMLHLKQ